jgi:hypothetical protein
VLNVEDSDQDNDECVEDGSYKIHVSSKAQDDVEMLISFWKW